MRSFTTLLAASLALSSAPAFATTNTSQDKQPADSKTSSATPSGAKYCVTQSPDEATGSRIYTRECRTKTEWAKRGVDIDEMQKQQ